MLCHATIVIVASIRVTLRVLLCTVATLSGATDSTALQTPSEAVWIPDAPDIEIVAPEGRTATPEARRSHWVMAKVTAYCPCALCCGPDARGVTATGTKTSRHPYGLAADPRLLPYGTRVRIPGYLEGTHPGDWWPVDDTGGAMRQDAEQGVLHIDCRLRSHSSARQFGVRYMWVEVAD